MFRLGIPLCRSFSKSSTVASTVAPSGCPACGVYDDGVVSCCGPGGTWHGKCGPVGNPNYEYTWGQGIKICYNQDKEEGKNCEMHARISVADSEYDSDTQLLI